jgi:hypothetical protein
VGKPRFKSLNTVRNYLHRLFPLAIGRFGGRLQLAHPGFNVFNPDRLIVTQLPLLGNMPTVWIWAPTARLI